MDPDARYIEIIDAAMKASAAYWSRVREVYGRKQPAFGPEVDAEISRLQAEKEATHRAWADAQAEMRRAGLG